MSLTSPARGPSPHRRRDLWSAAISGLTLGLALALASTVAPSGDSPRRAT